MKNSNLNKNTLLHLLEGLQGVNLLVLVQKIFK